MSKAGMVIVSAAALVVATACSSGSATSETSASAASSAAGGAIRSYKDAQPAVVQIVAEGEFRDVGMAEGQQGSWMGSGFIIDPSGLAVTNAHVAEGAATMKVYVGGSTDPVNARILGIDECSDLAVIDLEGDSFPYLAWHTGPVNVTTDVWAAGFPLGDPQYTVTDGTIAKNNADGQREWASIDYTLESTAPIQHGNSGGPLLMSDGSVVGVNYAGGSATNTDQFWAIPAALAAPVVDVLKTGQDQNSIGINGEAFFDDASSLGGIWVSGVRSGSPASEAGIEPGDVITQLEGRDAVTDSDVDTSGGVPRVTKAGYCNVIKTQGADRPIKVQVFRPTTGEVLEGEVNNPDKPLAPISTVTNDSAGQTGTDGGTSEGDAAAAGYTTVTDDTGAITVDVPVAWADVNTSAGDGFGQITASTSMDEFNNGQAPGVEYWVFDGALAPDAIESTMQDVISSDSFNQVISTCQDSEAGTVTNGDGYTYIGNQYWSCKGSDMSYYVSIRNYPDQDKWVLLDAQFTTDQDVEFLNRSLGSLLVN